MEGKKGTVVVAGATGRAGSCIVEESLKRGYLVRALLVKPFDPPQPPGLQKEGVELHYGDMTSVESLSKVMEGAQFVISAIGSKKPFSKKENDKIDNMGNQNLAKAAKAYAFIRRRGYVVPEDVRAICYDVLRHRVGLTYEAEAENITTENIISEILNNVEVP